MVSKKKRMAWIIPGIISGFVAIVLFIGGVTGSLVAARLQESLAEPFLSIVTWGGFAVACIFTGIAAFFARKLGRENDGSTSARTHIEQHQPVESPQASDNEVTGTIAAAISQTEGDNVVGQVQNIEHQTIYQNAAPPTAPSVVSDALHQLPPAPADFTGRQEELEDLLKKIGSGGVTISGLRGQGGIGKTALALVLAHKLTEQYPDAQFYLDLKGSSTDPLTPAQAMAHVIRAYEVTAQLPDDEATLQGMYHNLLREQKAILLMDNASDDKQVLPLIPPAGCVMLVTSRQKFALPGWISKDLDILSPEDSRDLLLLIAPRIGDFAEAIAKRCGYLPLALRLAGSALRERINITAEDYLGRLAEPDQRDQEFSQVNAALDSSAA